MKLIAIIIACLLYTGCATGYQSSAFSYTGGYYEVPVNDVLTKVVFSGNGYLSGETAATYTLFRCAELSQKANKPYFVIYSSLNHAAFHQNAQAPVSGSIGAAPVTYAFLRFVDTKVDGAFVTADVVKQLEASKAAAKKARTTKKSGGNI